ERAELTGFLDELQQAAQDFANISRDDLLGHQIVELALGIGHIEIPLVDAATKSLVKESANVLVVAPQGILADALDSFGGGVGQEDGAGDFEIRAVWSAPRFHG